MDTIINLILHDLQWLIVLFLLLFGGLVYAFMRERFLSTLGGFARVLISLFYGPVIYLKNVLEELTEYGTKGEQQFSTSRQYLLNKIFLALQALIVPIAVVILAGGILSGWNSFLPPKQLRVEIEQTEESLEENQMAMEQLEPRIAQFEKSWTTNRNALVNDLQRNRQKRIETWQAESQQLGKAIESVAEANAILAEVRSLHQQLRWSYQRTAENFYRLFLEARRLIARRGLPRDVAAPLHRYNEHWYRLSMIQFDQSVLSEEHIRAFFQPAYPLLKEEYDQLNTSVLEQTQRLTEMRSMAKLRFDQLFLEIALGLLQALAFVWVAGLLIEALWLGVSLATDVHLLRKRTEEKDGATEENQ
jgi:hypothetical protein